MTERLAPRIELVRQLADGHWHSGESLARAAGITRAAVWKRLQTLRDWGLEVQALTGRGYRLARPLELLDRDRVHAALSRNARTQLAGIELFPVMDSTNAWLMAQPDRDACLCLAEYQSAGRGRRGRGWVSPFAANLCLSFAWRFAEPPAQLAALGLAVGVGLAELLRATGAREVGLKWPNDLLWRGRKLAGILVEHRGEAGGPARVVIGVGLNLDMTARQAAAIDQAWVDLRSVLEAEGADWPGRNVLAAMVTDALLRVVQAYAGTGLAGFARRWAALDLARDRPVRLEQQGRSIEGIARGIDGDGALRLEAAGRTESWLSGDLSLRIADAS